MMLFWFYVEKLEPPAGLEPAIPGLGGRCLIHWATEAISNFTAQMLPIKSELTKAMHF